MEDRIQAIADAAALLFIRQGYARTQISHIAKAVGVSVGTIYLDFTGKKEIIQFILWRVVTPDCGGRHWERPITGAAFAGLEERISALFAQLGREFTRHLDDLAEYSFENLCSDAFDLMAKYAVGCLFLEKNQFDFPELAEQYRAYRKQFQTDMEQYFVRMAARGKLRPLEMPELAAALTVELLSSWAMDMRYIAFEPCSAPLDTVKRACLDHLTAAYGAR